MDGSVKWENKVGRWLWEKKGGKVAKTKGLLGDGMET